MGDINAKVGKPTSKSKKYGEFGLGVRNERGIELVDFCKINNLVITNTCFTQGDYTPGYLWMAQQGIKLITS